MKLWDVYVSVLVEAETEEQARDILSSGLEGCEHELHSCEELPEAVEEVMPDTTELVELELDKAEELRDGFEIG